MLNKHYTTHLLSMLFIFMHAYVHCTYVFMYILKCLNIFDDIKRWNLEKNHITLGLRTHYISPRVKRWGRRMEWAAVGGRGNHCHQGWCHVPVSQDNSWRILSILLSWVEPGHVETTLQINWFMSHMIWMLRLCWLDGLALRVFMALGLWPLKQVLGVL